MVIAAYTLAVAVPIAILIRTAVVGFAIEREIREADARCGRAIAVGTVKSDGDVRQEFATVAHAVGHYEMLMLDLRKWTHRQFFPHGSAR